MKISLRLDEIFQSEPKRWTPALLLLAWHKNSLSSLQHPVFTWLQPTIPHRRHPPCCNDSEPFFDIYIRASLTLAASSHHFTHVETQPPSFCHHLAHKSHKATSWQTRPSHADRRSTWVLDYYWVGGSGHFAQGHFNWDELVRQQQQAERFRSEPFTGLSPPLPVYFKALLITHETLLNYSKTNTSEHKGVKLAHQALI